MASILAPEYKFTPQTGTWGLHGIVQFGGGPNYAFFVTFGQEQSGHEFDEGISESGVVRWQSQPRHDFDSPTIRNLIAHDESKNEILLFLRSGPDRPYLFLGHLKYLAHDSERVKPVYFQWQLIDFDRHSIDFNSFGITLTRDEDTDPGAFTNPIAAQRLVESSQPSEPSARGNGLPTQRFRHTTIDYEERDLRNRKLGRAGELLVLLFEKTKLIQAGRRDLADLVEHTSVTLGDGAGFDVKSFDTDTGEEVHIEVKTTRGSKRTAFFMSANEKQYVERCKVKYLLYRIYEYNSNQEQIQFFTLTAQQLLGSHEFAPTTFRVHAR